MAIVYALHNNSEDKLYIGCTRGNLAKRFREHRCLLRAGRHTCKPLQDAWDRGGDFEMRALATCGDTLEERREGELFYFGIVPKERLYNEPWSFRPTDEAIRNGIAKARTVRGNRWTPEANLKRSLAQKGIPKGHGAKISATKRAKRELGDEIV